MPGGAVGWMRVRRGGEWGPWHKLNYDGSQTQAWCGSKMTGFAKEWTKTDDEPDGRVCPGCKAALTADRPKAWRKR